MTNTFLFDIGNVLVDWNPRHLLHQLIPVNDELDFFLTEVCPQSWNEEQDLGRAWPDGLQEAISRHPNYREVILAYYDRWLETVGGPIQGSVDILRALRSRGYRTFALSNFARETFELTNAVYPFLDEFDGRLVSGYEGIIKPEPAIFQLAIDRFELIAEQTLFIDDSAPNIDAARNLGFQTHHFEHPDGLRKQLLTLGVIS